MCFYYLMGFCGSVPQTRLPTDNTLEFFKGSNFSKTEWKKSLKNSAIQLFIDIWLQLPLTFLLGGVTDTYLVKLAAMALSLYLALFQTSGKPCIPENLPVFPTVTKNPIFLMLLYFHDTTITFQEDISFPNSQPLIYSHSSVS